MRNGHPKNSVGVWFIAAGALALGACGSFATPAPEAIATERPTQPARAATGASTPEVGASPTAGEGSGRCQPLLEPLPSLTEGPYFTAGSPQRTSLVEPGTAGETLVLSGYVFDTECIPLPGTKLDFWQADGNGAYDSAGFRLRGHQFTDEEGAYALTTVIPGMYPGRTEHIHVKVQAQGGTALTTQLFFPEATGNQADRIFDERLVIGMSPAADGWMGAFDFIIEIP